MALQGGHILPCADFFSLNIEFDLFGFFTFVGNSYIRVYISVGKFLFIYRTINFYFILLLKFYLYIDYFVYQTHLYIIASFCVRVRSFIQCVVCVYIIKMQHGNYLYHSDQEKLQLLMLSVGTLKCSSDTI